MAAQAKQEEITLEDYCARFRALEHVEEAMVLMDNPAAQKLLSQWSRSVPFDGKIPLPKAISGSALWDHIWESAPPGIEKVRSACGLDDMDFCIAYQQLRDARLIYPDGKPHEEAMRLLRGMIAAALPSQFRKKRNP